MKGGAAVKSVPGADRVLSASQGLVLVASSSPFLGALRCHFISVADGGVTVLFSLHIRLTLPMKLMNQLLQADCRIQNVNLSQWALLSSARPTPHWASDPPKASMIF